MVVFLVRMIINRMYKYLFKYKYFQALSVSYHNILNELECLIHILMETSTLIIITKVIKKRCFHFLNHLK